MVKIYRTHLALVYSGSTVKNGRGVGLQIKVLTAKDVARAMVVIVSGD